MNMNVRQTHRSVGYETRYMMVHKAKEHEIWTETREAQNEHENWDKGSTNTR